MTLQISCLFNTVAASFQNWRTVVMSLNGAAVLCSRRYLVGSDSVSALSFTEGPRFRALGPGEGPASVPPPCPRTVTWSGRLPRLLRTGFAGCPSCPACCLPARTWGVYTSGRVTYRGTLTLPSVPHTPPHTATDPHTPTHSYTSQLLQNKVLHKQLIRNISFLLYY